MSKGHNIPLLQLARLILTHGITFTMFNTPANRPFVSTRLAKTAASMVPFVSTRLAKTAASIITLPFPKNIDGVLKGVESTDKLPSMSLFVTFATSTKLMKPHFEEALGTLPNVTL